MAVVEVVFAEEGAGGVESAAQADPKRHGAVKTTMRVRRNFSRWNDLKICMTTCFLLRCGPPRPRFCRSGNAGMKKPSLPHKGDEGWTAGTGTEETPLPSCLLARQSPGPHDSGLDERKKAGLLTSGSSYSFRLAALSRSGFVEFSSPVTAALPHRIFTCFPILPRRETGGTFLRVGPAFAGQISKS